MFACVCCGVGEIVIIGTLLSFVAAGASGIAAMINRIRYNRYLRKIQKLSGGPLDNPPA